MSLAPDYPQNVPDANQGNSVGLAAPGFVGVGCTKTISEPSAVLDCRNRAAWMSVSSFLTIQNFQIVMRDRAAKALAAPASVGGAPATSAEVGA